MPTPVIVTAEQHRANPEGTLASGDTLEIQVWEGSAPYELHVHRKYDIAWHVLEGVLRFRFSDGVADLAAGSTLFVPANTPHTYGIEPALLIGAKPEGRTRYLVFGPTVLFKLFKELEVARTGRPHTDWGAGPTPESMRNTTPNYSIVGPEYRAIAPRPPR